MGLVSAHVREYAEVVLRGADRPGEHSMTDHKTYEIRARLMAARSVHPGPWHVVGGTLVDGEGRPIDFDATVAIISA